LQNKPNFSPFSAQKPRFAQKQTQNKAKRTQFTCPDGVYRETQFLAFKAKSNPILLVPMSEGSGDPDAVYRGRLSGYRLGNLGKMGNEVCSLKYVRCSYFTAGRFMKIRA
jgi:hypothetical protein